VRKPLLLFSVLVLSANAPRHGEASEIIGLYPEFSDTGTLILGFSELVEHHPQTLVDIVAALDGRVPIVGVVANDVQYQRVHEVLKNGRAPMTNLDVVQVPLIGMWMRDYGPAFVRLPDGRFMVLDAIYGREDHAPDEWVPRYLAGYFHLPVVDVPLRVTGGNLLTNGEGWVFTTSQVVEFNARDGASQNDVAQVLARYYGATDWMVLKPLLGEPTQHIDMFVTLVAPDTAVISRIDEKVDPVNAKRLDEAAAQLASVKTRSGPMKVVRVPMPAHEDGKWRSYTNVIFANDTLLVPTYPDVSPKMDRESLRIYSELLPERRIVPIDASSIIQRNGSLHCISVNSPVIVRVSGQ
jgi:agmatine deiminase